MYDKFLLIVAINCLTPKLSALANESIPGFYNNFPLLMMLNNLPKQRRIENNFLCWCFCYVSYQDTIDYTNRTNLIHGWSSSTNVHTASSILFISSYYYDLFTTICLRLQNFLVRYRSFYWLHKYFPNILLAWLGPNKNINIRYISRVLCISGIRRLDYDSYQAPSTRRMALLIYLISMKQRSFNLKFELFLYSYLICQHYDWQCDRNVSVITNHRFANSKSWVTSTSVF